MQKLAIKLSLSVDNMNTRFVPALLPEFCIDNDIYLIPYDNMGFKSNYIKSVLNLREGSTVKLTSGPYATDEGTVIGKSNEGHYKIQFSHSVGKSKVPRPFERLLGSWWIQSAIFGSVEIFPIVNIAIDPVNAGADCKF